jgi:hypothetical protein
LTGSFLLRPEDGGSTFFRNAGNHLLDYIIDFGGTW